VENEAGSPIIDGAAQLCQDFFGSSSCGWSDGNVITAYAGFSGRPLGPFTASPELLEKIQAEHEVWLSLRGLKN